MRRNRTYCSRASSTVSNFKRRPVFHGPCQRKSCGLFRAWPQLFLGLPCGLQSFPVPPGPFMLFFNALPETGGAQAARLIVHLEHCRVTVLFPGSRPAAAFTVQPQLHFVSSGIHIYHPMVFRMLCIQPCLVAAPDDFPISALGRDFPGHRDIRVVGQPPGIIRHMGGRSAMGHGPCAGRRL